MQLIASRPGSAPLPTSLHDRLARVTPAALHALVARYAIPRPRGSSGHLAVRQALLDDLSEAMGSTHHVSTDAAGNLIAGDPGAARVLIGAHYDSVANTPGADDNASALAALVAAARAIGPDHAVLFVAFDGEESGFVGSRFFVERQQVQPTAQVHILEMVGYASRQPGSQRNPLPMIDAPDVGDFLAVVASHRSREALSLVLDAARSHDLPVQILALPDLPLDQVGRISPHLLRSDHAPFWWADQPALMWTDTAEFRNPQYHQPTDSPDTLDYPFLAAVTSLLIHVATRDTL